MVPVAASRPEPDFSLETLFEELLGEPADVRAEFYLANGVPKAVSSLAEELFVAHASVDFELPESPSLAELGTSEELTGVGTILDGRYRLDAVLGGGSFGTVFRGLDLLTKDAVAVKVPSIAPLSRAALEREAACLRRLEHGVARLRDQGVFVGEAGSESHYLVFDLVEGSPFPGNGCKREAFFSLVRSLAAVHARGVVHRDLKPENVLVTQDDAAFLVDFGIAHGPAFGAARAGRDLSVGTEAFAAPEQLDGEMGDASSDVYSCALMGLSALTGVGTANLRDVQQPPSPLDPLDGDLCERLFAVVSGSREDRPRNAQELWAEGSGRGRAPSQQDPSALVRLALEVDGEGGELDWKPLFTGIEPIHHLRSGAAKELGRRCGSDRAAASRVVREWIERGVAFWSGERIELHAAGLDALRSEPIDSDQHGSATMGELATEADPYAKADWVSDVCRRVSQLEDLGWREQASSVLVSSLAQVRTWPLGSSAAERRMLPVLVRLAVQDGSLLALDRAAFETARSRTHGPLREALDFAIQVARASALGDSERTVRGAEREVSPLEAAAPEMKRGGRSAGELADEISEWDRFVDVVISTQYHGSLALDQAHGQRVRRALALRLREYAGERRSSGPLRSSRFRWLALRAYRRGHFGRSAALYRASADVAKSAYSIASCRLTAASAAMEAGAFSSALADVAGARKTIEALPFPGLEARAIWTLRTLRFRMGELPDADLELDAAFELLGSASRSALYSLTEAAIARAAGDQRRWRLMAEASFEAFRTLGQSESTALARALVIDSGGAASPEDAQLFGSLSASSDAGVALQVLALAPGARDACTPLLAGWLEAARHTLPQSPDGRLDVLDVAELEARLGLPIRSRRSRPSD